MLAAVERNPGLAALGAAVAGGAGNLLRERFNQWLDSVDVSGYLPNFLDHRDRRPLLGGRLRAVHQPSGQLALPAPAAVAVRSRGFSRRARVGGSGPPFYRSPRSPVMFRRFRSFGGGRRRMRTVPFRRRRFTRRAGTGSIRRMRTGVSVPYKLLVDSISGVSVISISGSGTGTGYSAFGGGTSSAGFVNVNEHCLTTGTDGFTAGNAMTFIFSFSLGHLSANHQAYAGIIGVAYDMYRIEAVEVRLKASFDPKVAMQTTLPTASTPAIDFTHAPQYDDNITWIERDGTLSFQTTGSLGGGITAIPLNGDLSDLCRNRHRARRHKAFKDIVRFIRPKPCLAVCQPTTAGPSNTSFNVGLWPDGMRAPQMASATANTPHYGLGVAFSYKGFIGTTTFQVKHPYIPQVTYHIRGINPLF